MKPFFSIDKVKSNNINLKNPQSCTSCGLYKKCKSSRMKPNGKNRKKVMFIGDFPNEIDDRRNKQWQGRTGRLLQNTLKKFGFDLFSDGVSYNSVNCKTSKNRNPTSNEIYCCRPNVFKAIKQHKPHIVFLLGNIPIESVIGGRWKKDLGGIAKWRGWQIPDQELKCWICPIYHPSFVSRNEDRQGRNQALSIWERDIYNGLQLIDKPVPDYSNVQMEFIKNNKDLRKLCSQMKKADLLSFDYETTGLKPHADYQKLVSTSVAFDGKCYAWMNVEPNKHFMSKRWWALTWKKVLTSNVPKAAHNLQMEEEWSYWKLGTPVNNWKICTMNSSHCLDNRSGITSLKFQTYVNFGIVDYDSNINNYLKSPDNKLGANSVNRIFDFIKEYGEDELLKYNAYDSYWGLLLAQKHIKQLKL